MSAAAAAWPPRRPAGFPALEPSTADADEAYVNSLLVEAGGEAAALGLPSLTSSGWAAHAPAAAAAAPTPRVLAAAAAAAAYESDDPSAQDSPAGAANFGGGPAAAPSW